MPYKRRSAPRTTWRSSGFLALPPIFRRSAFGRLSHRAPFRSRNHTDRSERKPTPRVADLLRWTHPRETDHLPPQGRPAAGFTKAPPPGARTTGAPPQPPTASSRILPSTREPPRKAKIHPRKTVQPMGSTSYITASSPDCGLLSHRPADVRVSVPHSPSRGTFGRRSPSQQVQGRGGGPRAGQSSLDERRHLRAVARARGNRPR